MYSIALNHFFPFLLPPWTCSLHSCCLSLNGVHLPPLPTSAMFSKRQRTPLGTGATSMNEARTSRSEQLAAVVGRSQCVRSSLLIHVRTAPDVWAGSCRSWIRSPSLYILCDVFVKAVFWRSITEVLRFVQMLASWNNGSAQLSEWSYQFTWDLFFMFFVFMIYTARVVKGFLFRRKLWQETRLGEQTSSGCCQFCFANRSIAANLLFLSFGWKTPVKILNKSRHVISPLPPQRATGGPLTAVTQNVLVTEWRIGWKLLGAS